MDALIHPVIFLQYWKSWTTWKITATLFRRVWMILNNSLTFQAHDHSVSGLQSGDKDLRSINHPSEIRDPAISCNKMSLLPLFLTNDWFYNASTLRLLNKWHRRCFYTLNYKKRSQNDDWTNYIDYRYENRVDVYQFLISLGYEYLIFLDHQKIDNGSVRQLISRNSIINFYLVIFPVFLYLMKLYPGTLPVWLYEASTIRFFSVFITIGWI